MSRLVTYRDLIRQRVEWNKALKTAKFFRGSQLLDYALNVDVEYASLVDEYRKGASPDILAAMAKQLMQLQAIQDVLEERAAK